MDDDGVAIADERERRGQLGAVEVFARDVVGEGAVDVNAVELPISVLLQGADPGLADLLTVHNRPMISKCQDEIHDPRREVAINRNTDSNLP